MESKEADDTTKEKQRPPMSNEISPDTDRAIGNDPRETIEPCITQEPESYDIVANDTKPKFHLLSLDGGGTRGYWTLLFLQRLMQVIGYLEERGTDVGSSFAPYDMDPNCCHTNWSKLQASDRGSPGASDTDADPDVVEKRKAPAEQRYLPCHYFHYIGGSSTGALIAIMLGRLRMTVADCLQEYQHLAGKVFGSPNIFCEMNIPLPLVSRTKYSPKGLEAVLSDVIARRLPLNDTIDSRFPLPRGVSKVFVTSFNTNEQKIRNLALFRTYDDRKRYTRTATMQVSGSSILARANSHGPRSRGTNLSSASQSAKPVARKRQIEKGPKGWEIANVAGAAVAAPLFFPAIKSKEGNETVKYTDGGFSSANNPSWEGLEEITERWGKNSVGTVLSVGTARHDPQHPNKYWRMPGRVREWTDEMTDPTPVHKRVLDESKKGPGFPYFRFNAEGKYALKVQMDDWKPRSFGHKAQDVGSKTKEYIEGQFERWVGQQEVQEQLQQCARQLVEDRRAMSQLPEWERFATCAAYPCRVAGCERDDVFESKEDFCRHLRAEHGYSDDDEIAKKVKRSRELWRYRPRPE